MKNAYIARSTDLAMRMFGEETMILSPRDSSLFNLNEVASAIWEAVDGRTPLQQIVEQNVCATFDVTPEEAMKDAETFVQELAAHGILKLSQEPIPRAERTQADAKRDSAQPQKQGSKK